MKRPAIKAPPFLSNLYRDLRDRRLLPLVVVLLVAIPALPFVLGDSTDAQLPATSGTEGALAEEEIPTLPAVLASDPGLRDYRKRLDALRSKNPFAQQFSLPAEAEKAVSASAITNVGAAGASAAAPSGSAPSSVAAGSTVGASTATSGSISSGDSGSSTTSGGSGTAGGGDGSTPSSGVQFYTFRIDVVTGRAGDTERRRNVKRLTVLPSQSNPVAVFMGVAEEGKKASFLVSTDVVRSHGDGSCSPNPADCQLLTLRVGEERKFEYAPTGEPDTYVIHLKDIRVVPIDDPRRSGADRGGRDSQSAESGLEAFLGL